MKVIKVAKLNFFHWRSNPKYTVVIVYLLLYTYERVSGLAGYARDLGAQISPWVFPFLPCTGTGFLPLMLGFILLISDAPFRTGHQQMVMQRTGKRTWLAGQLIYILTVSISFTIFMWLLSWLYVIPELEWSNKWGAVLSTATINGVPGTYHVYLSFPYTVIKNTDPLSVTLWCSAAMASVCFFLGVMMAVCNLWMRKGWGSVIIACVTAISLIPDTSATNPGPIRYILWVSPLNWMDYSLMGHPEQYLPSYGFAIWGPAVLGIGLSVLLLLTIGKCNIETDKE